MIELSDKAIADLDESLAHSAIPPVELPTVTEETLFPDPPHVKVRIENALDRMRWLSTLFNPCPVQCESFCTIAQACVGVLEHARKRLELVEKLTEDGAPYDQFYSDLLDLRSNLRSAIRYLELAERAGA